MLFEYTVSYLHLFVYMQMGVSYTDMTFFTLSQYDLVSSNLSLSLNANFTVTK